MRQSLQHTESTAKSFFLGPQAENADWLLQVFTSVLDMWFTSRRRSYPEDGTAISLTDQKQPAYRAHQAEMEQLVRDLMLRYEAEPCKFSPRYIGHMFSEISMPALLGHVISLLYNPNIIASEAGLVGVQVEQEAIQALLRMVGFPLATAQGHFTSGGTIANYEAVLRARERCALWMARRLLAGEKSYFKAAHCGWQLYDTTPEDLLEQELIVSRKSAWHTGPRLRELTGRSFSGPVMLIPRSKHYSWMKAAHLLGIGEDSLWQVALDQEGKMSLAAIESALLRARAEDRPILMLVSVAGTTELGEVDRIHEIQNLLDRYQREDGLHLWHHVDGAYGGFFCSLGDGLAHELAPDVWGALEAIRRVDSLTIDPHKLGYVPYASGAFLAREARDYFVTRHDAPYIQYKDQGDKGRFTLEGSRSAGGATATWLTAKSIGLDSQGYGQILAQTVRQRRALEQALRAAHSDIQLAPAADTNILCLHIAHAGQALSESNARTEELYLRFQAEDKPAFYISKTVLERRDYGAYLDTFVGRWQAQLDQPRLVLLRFCLMNPFFASGEMKTDFSAELITRIRDFAAADSNLA